MLDLGVFLTHVESIVLSPCPHNQELSQDSFSSQSSAPPSNQPMASNKSSQEDSMQARPSSLPVSPLFLYLTSDLC